MQLLSTFIDRIHLPGVLIVTSIAFLVSAQLYDVVFEEVPCHLCILQRVVLALLFICSMISLRLQRHFMLTPLLILGLILSLRHAYVLMYPEQVTQCLPFELIMDLTGVQFLHALQAWFASLGRECSIHVGMITYLLVAMLTVYYLFSLYLLSRAPSSKRT